MTEQTKQKFVAKQLERPTRLDRVIREQFPDWPRRSVTGLINSRKVRVDGRIVWICSWQVNNGATVEISGAPSRKKTAVRTLEKKWVIARESDLIAVAKPEGMLSHATRSERTGDLLSLVSEEFGPVALFHRLDRDTSGIVLFTFNGPINRYLDTAFKEGSVAKEYLAVTGCEADLEPSGYFRERIGRHPKRRDRMRVVERGGQRASTRYEVLGEAEGMRLLRLWPETGRTHQLRVHLANRRSPILGDRAYSPGPPPGHRLLLHARRITLPDQDGFPERSFSARIPKSFLAPLPRDLKRLAISIANED